MSLNPGRVELPVISPPRALQSRRFEVPLSPLDAQTPPRVALSRRGVVSAVLLDQ
jgi:hypothetical protein